MSSDEKLIDFLRELANSVENKQLNSKQLQSIGEFFMSYKFQEQAIRSLNYTDEDEDMSEEELLKFISLGWYVYRIILKNKM